jgi:ArsR family transcriptional regulator
MPGSNDRLMEMKAEVFAAVGQPVRLAIVELLAAGPMCVCDIAAKVHAERSNVSRHLAVLVQAGVLSCTKQGLKMIYTLERPCILDAVKCVEKVIRQRITDVAKALQPAGAS